MIFLTEEIAAFLEAKLNETQEGLESPFYFKTNTIIGAYDRDYLITPDGRKKEYIYTIVTDPIGEVVPIRGTNSTIQQVELHILFKIKYRKQMYYSINKFLENMAGLYIDVPGAQLASGENTKVSFVASLPYFEDKKVSLNSFDNRVGTETNTTFSMLEATITINMTTSTNTVFMGNEMVYTLTQGSDSENLVCADNVHMSCVCQTSSEQKPKEIKALSINTSAQFSYSFQVYISGLITNSIKQSLELGNLNNNVIYELTSNNGVLENKSKVILTGAEYINVFGGISMLSLTFTTADSNLLGDDTNAS